MKESIVRSNKLLYVEPKDAAYRISFWKAALRHNMEFLLANGVKEYNDLKKLDARALLDEPLWKIPEINGKYHARYFSRSAWERTLKEEALPSRTGGKWQERRAILTLEHVVERKPLIEWLFEDPSRIDIIDQICLGCVVDKTEDKKLPKKFKVDPGNLWNRYLLAKIDVYDRLLDRWHVLDGQVQ